MLPFVYGFTWDAGNIIFLGAFFAVACIIAITLLRTTLRTKRALTQHTIDELRWHAGFEELPASARVCRHAFTGETPDRRCANAFSCDACTDHPRFQKMRAQSSAPRTATPLGFLTPLDRLYHRGHSWVRQEGDGTVTVGLDDLGMRMFGAPDAIELPPVGTALNRNGAGWMMKSGAATVNVLAPVSGTVVAHGQPADAWILRMRPAAGESLEHLLRGAEVRQWMQQEFERFQRVLAQEAPGVTLADGGEPIQELASVIPPRDRERVYLDMFLQP